MGTNLADICNIKNDIIADRINKFALICKMGNVKISEVRGNAVKVVSGKCNPEFEESEYFITARETNDQELGKGILLSGYFADLNFSFTNYLKGNKYSIKLDKAVSKDEYVFIINPADNDEVEFSITKNYFRKGNIVPENYTFYYKTKDFNEILNIIYTFVYNPEFAFAEYKRIYNDKLPKKIVFGKDDLDDAIMTSGSLELAGEKVKKIGKKSK